MLRPAVRSILLGGRWTPAKLFRNGEQGGWYDPSDFSTMFQDSAGTTPVTAVTQPVGKILDKSGRGNHLTQATTTSRPTLQQDAGGHYYLNFDGVDDSLTLTWASSIAQPSTGVLAFTFAAVPGGNSYLYSGTTAGGRQDLFLDQLSRVDTFAGSQLASAAISVATPYVVQSLYNGATSQQRINKTSVVSGDAGAAASGALGIGGFNGGTSFYSAHKNYGVVFISRGLTTTEKNSVDTYLGSKMGIAL